MRRKLALPILLTLALASCASDEAQTASSASEQTTEESAAPSPEQPASTKATTASPPSTEPTSDVTQSVVFRFGEDDLCTWFTDEEILAIARTAYEEQGLDLPIPEALIAEPGDGFSDRPGCEWTVPGTPRSWGRDDFTVALLSENDQRLDDGTTLVDSTKADLAAGAYGETPGTLATLLPEGVSWVPVWSPGFGAYVESEDTLLNFRHDFAAGAPRNESPVLEARMLTAILQKMNWLAEDDR